MLLAAVFDFCDGLAARALGAYSPVGKELDSLADLISFGIVPSSMLYFRYSQNIVPLVAGASTFPFWKILAFFPFVMSVASALRLARFNLDERQRENFIGLPTPANALMTASLLLSALYLPRLDQWLSNLWFIPVWVLLFSWLLNSPLPLFSMKVKHPDIASNKERIVFILSALVLVVIALVFRWPWSLTLFDIMLLYLLLSVLFATILKSGPRRK